MLEVDHVGQFRSEWLGAELSHVVRAGVDTGRSGYRLAGRYARPRSGAGDL